MTSCAGNDTDEVKTVEDKMDHRSKRRLMNQVRTVGNDSPLQPEHCVSLSAILVYTLQGDNARCTECPCLLAPCALHSRAQWSSLIQRATI